MTAEPNAAAYNIHDAKTNLSRIIDRVERGEEIIISRAGTPVARVVPLNPRAERTGRGLLAGRLRLADDWDSPALNDAIARDFGLAPP
jgi:prevent-host-death family protein